MTQNGHVYAICSRPEVAISGRNVKTADSSGVLYFEVASSNSFRAFSKRFSDGDVGDGSIGANSICSLQEVVADVISGDNAETFRSGNMAV